MKKRTLSALLLFFCTSVVTAQQDPQFSMNMHNKLFSNPGYAGSGGKKICGSILGRHQWTGFTGNPKSYVFNGHTLLGDMHGVGLSVLSDQLGQEKSVLVKGMYSFRINSNLGIGIGVGLQNKRFGTNWLPPQTPIDPAIPNGLSASTVDLDLGVYYNTNNLYFGLSTTHLNAPKIQSNTSFQYNIVRNYYVTAGYRFRLPNGMVLEPSIFAKSDAASAQIDLNTVVHFNNQVWAGVSYRYADAIVPMIGVTRGPVMIGYSYDITTSAINKYSSGSHEIMLKYCLDIPEFLTKGKTVRFM